jgi:hypothetical protein
MVLKFGAKNKWIAYEPLKFNILQSENQQIEVLSRTHQKK